MIPIIIHQAIIDLTLASYMQMSDKTKLDKNGDSIGAGRIYWVTHSHMLLQDVVHQKLEAV